MVDLSSSLCKRLPAGIAFNKQKLDFKWVWVNTYRYIFSGLFTSINPSYDLGFTRGTRLLTHPQQKGRAQKDQDAKRRWSLLRFGLNNKKRLGCQSTNNANNVCVYIYYIYTYSNRTFGVQPKWLSKGVSKCAPMFRYVSRWHDIYCFLQYRCCQTLRRTRSNRWTLLLLPLFVKPARNKNWGLTS